MLLTEGKKVCFEKIKKGLLKDKGKDSKRS